MALGVASLTLDDSQASLASMPEELWRKIASYLTPATTARAFVVASGSSSLQKALRAEIEQTERDQFGATRREAVMALHISTRTFLCRRGEPPPDAAADEPEGGLEAYARHFM